MLRLRRSRGSPEGSLFPFLSVLACVIGVLALMIAALAVGQVASDLRRGREADPAELAVLSDDVAALAARVERADREREELEALRAELRALGLAPEQPEELRSKAVADRTAAARVEALERERDELEASLRSANSDWQQRRTLDTDPPIALQPRGRGDALKPFFVECRARSVRIHSADEDWSIPLDLAQPADLDQLNRFLRGVRGYRDGTVIFLIRPDGVESYQQAENQARKLGVRSGKLPLPGNGELDFRLL